MELREVRADAYFVSVGFGFHKPARLPIGPLNLALFVEVISQNIFQRIVFVFGKDFWVCFVRRVLKNSLWVLNKLILNLARHSLYGAYPRIRFWNLKTKLLDLFESPSLPHRQDRQLHLLVVRKDDVEMRLIKRIRLFLPSAHRHLLFNFNVLIEGFFIGPFFLLKLFNLLLGQSFVRLRHHLLRFLLFFEFLVYNDDFLPLFLVTLLFE